MDFGYSERRRKGKDKKRERKRHPYRKGGRFRTMNVEEDRVEKESS